MIKIAKILLALIVALLLPFYIQAQAQDAFVLRSRRPPAVPLVVHDPYFSIWSMTDRLTDDWPKHWTNHAHAMAGLVRIDGKPYRVMGIEPKEVPALEQVNVEVLPTRTVYDFANEAVNLKLTFLTPTLPHDMYLSSRPATYVLWEAVARDGRPHDVSLYMDASAEITVNEPYQEVEWSRLKVGDMAVMRVGTAAQPMLEKSGDDLRIDWGHLYLGQPEAAGAANSVITDASAARESFAAGGTLPANDSLSMPRRVNDGWPVLACTYELGKVSETTVSRHLIMAYDSIWGLEYMNQRLRPFWRTRHEDPASMLAEAASHFEELKGRCEAYDAELMADLTAAGGDDFAYLCALAFRQCMGAHKIAADYEGSPLMFSKENHSNGCIGTVDVIYPASPFFLLFNPEMLKAQLRPVLDYAASDRWRWPFAPHDLGTYPLANGQVYGGGEATEKDQMPVEESGNMLIMLAALARQDGNADFAKKWWPDITKWAEYLREKGFDPENQLSTDDFAGHLAHNTNLSIKAILGMGGYGVLCELDGSTTEAAEWKSAAAAMARQWVEKADDGDHFRLAFDKPGTWSQKYNLVWDSLLGLDLFPNSVAATELAFYKTKMQKYGLPLDNRETYTKLDWAVWTASLTKNREDFEFFIKPLADFADETPSRVPMTDWYQTPDGRMMNFKARPVVGGIFMPMLYHGSVAAKYRGMAKD